jgi:hypothetical protein
VEEIFGVLDGLSVFGDDLVDVWVSEALFLLVFL